MKNLLKVDAYQVGVIGVTIANDDADAATGREIVRLPTDAIVLSVNRRSTLTGGSSPGASVGISGTGTEVAASGTTSVATNYRCTQERTLYAAITGSPTGGSIDVRITFCQPQ